MTEVGTLGDLCEAAWVLPTDNPLEDSAKCHRDAVGQYDLMMGDTVIAIMDLCDEHVEEYRENSSFDRVRERKSAKR